jgi:hypothetical protein
VAALQWGLLELKGDAGGYGRVGQQLFQGVGGGRAVAAAAARGAAVLLCVLPIGRIEAGPVKARGNGAEGWRCADLHGGEHP